MIVSHEYFMWFISALIVGTASAWFAVDLIRLQRAVHEGRKARDRIFGSITGLIVVIIGITGVLLFHLG